MTNVFPLFTDDYWQLKVVHYALEDKFQIPNFKITGTRTPNTLDAKNTHSNSTKQNKRLLWHVSYLSTSSVNKRSVFVYIVQLCFSIEDPSPPSCKSSEIT